VHDEIGDGNLDCKIVDLDWMAENVDCKDLMHIFEKLL
jgi:hypothetical protein